MDRNLALTADQLTVSFGKNRVLWDISLEIPTNNIVGIIGPNGAGKTTLFKTALGITKPLSGNISILGECCANKILHKIAYVPQRDTIDWEFPITVFNVVLMGRYGRLGLFKRPRVADRDAAMQALEMLGMADCHNKQIAQLSGGQQQKLFVARALVQDPEIYLMDEPFAGIDITTEQIVIELFRKLASNGKTVFVIHHDLNTVENYFDWLVMLNTRLVASGKVATTFNNDNIRKCFGKNYLLFDEAEQLSKAKLSGLKK
jgi:manganese/zinc/iron transport system ATP- binding protein